MCPRGVRKTQLFHTRFRTFIKLRNKLRIVCVIFSDEITITSKLNFEYIKHANQVKFR